MSLFTAHEFLEVVDAAFMLPENVPQKREKPRASAMTSDAREIAYMMANTPHIFNDFTEQYSAQRTDKALTAQQGRHMEDLSVVVMEYMGFHVVDRQITLPDVALVTGHPDGRVVEGDGLEPEGLIYGWEHKHPGRYDFTKILKARTIMAPESKTEWVIQAMLYGAYLKWDAVQFVVIAQDSSAVALEARINANAKNPAFRWGDKVESPKLWVESFDLRPFYKTLLLPTLERAQFFIDWYKGSGDPRDVQMEHNPYPVMEGRSKGLAVGFPWSWSNWLGNAVIDGQSGVRAPSIPGNITGGWDASNE